MGKQWEEKWEPADSHVKTQKGKWDDADDEFSSPEGGIMFETEKKWKRGNIRTQKSGRRRLSPNCARKQFHLVIKKKF